LWNPNRQAEIRSQIYLDKHANNSGESYVDHYIRYANLASSLDPPMTDMDLLSTVTSHYEPRVQQGLLCGNFKCTQDVLGYLSKVQGMHENRDNFRNPRREYPGGESNSRHQPDARRDEGPRNRRQNVDVRRQSDRRRPNFNDRRQNRAEDGHFYGRRQGRAVGDSSGQLNPDAQLFYPRVETAPSDLSRNDRGENNGVRNLNN